MLAAWVVVFLVNLPVPVMFGNLLTEGNARLGMMMGTILLGLIGGIICQRSYRICLALNSGGLVVALTQFVAIPQFIAGSIGLLVSTTLGLADVNFDAGRDEMTLWGGGFVTTIVTGALLMGLALGIGLVFQLLGLGRDRLNRIEKPSIPE
ncbi:hypothetical protein AB1L88_09325 [Tautonia sp. JC769]|uniref:hypothetical protein n=1 Tax=Tautonia sp. JC769 TaxID=3232135 RepID=UPI00345AC613